MINSYLQHGLKNGYLNPFIGRTYALEDAARAQTDIISNVGASGRLVLKI
jgi:NADPH:quinone reductase-like Zn-dependent oxidoreductase